VVLDYYKLAEEPFGVTPNPRFLYLSPTHREALASLSYGVEAARGFMSIIATPGMGKTTLLFQLLQGLQNSARTVFLFQTVRSPEDLLRSLLRDLEAPDAGDDIVQMQSQLNQHLLNESRRGKRFVVVIDEAQNLPDSVLEFVRMFSNFETPREKLMQIVLAGQPQLAERLAAPNLLQLRQRISIMARLEPFSPEETNHYVGHRLLIAGYDFRVPLFTPKAGAMIAEYSQGIPRNINNICFNALSLGCVLKQRSIDENVIAEVMEDLGVRPVVHPSLTVRKQEEFAPDISRVVATKTLKSSCSRGSSLRPTSVSAMLLMTMLWSVVAGKADTPRISLPQTFPIAAMRTFVPQAAESLSVTEVPGFSVPRVTARGPVAQKKNLADLWAQIKIGHTSAEVALARLYLKDATPNCAQARILLAAAAGKGSSVAKELLRTTRCQ